MYTVASPDPNPRGGGQLPNPNECNSTLTSGTNNIYPHPYIDVNDRGHRSRSGHRLRLSYSFVCSVCLGLLQENLCFKFARSGKIRRIWNTLMQVWMTGYREFLLEAIGMFVGDAELFFLFQAFSELRP